MESTGLSFHLFSDWRECRRAFYFRRVAHLRGPERRGLSLGNALHDAVASWRGFAEWKESLWSMLEDAQFDSPEERKSAWLKLSSWMSSWTLRYGFITAGQCEKEFFAPTPFGQLSCRIDWLEESPALVIEDLKTSSYKSNQGIIESEMASDQFTHYAYIIRHVFGTNPAIRIITANFKESIPQPYVGDPWYVSIPDQEDYILGLEHDFYEICESIEAFDAGIGLSTIFPRTSMRCAAWGCEYAPICRAVNSFDVRNDNYRAPSGFGVDSGMHINLFRR